MIEHPYFQRLRRITQLGLSHYVYPGALHTRFHHALGALHLMGMALEVLKSKGHVISNEEAEAVCIGILLHDIGHGPYSHTLEHCIIKDVDHEFLSEQIMERLNEEYDGKLTMAIEVFKNRYPKKFLHQLISSQLDMDRLDYLKRDSFFTGVYEGVIGHDRIIKMLNIVNDEIVVEEKGIYSIEKFLVARRLMYWQVYLHKTVISAEQMLVKVLLRAKELAEQKVELNCSEALHYFLYNKINKASFLSNKMALENFTNLDDIDVFSALKCWVNHQDKVLSQLCKRLLERRLFKIELRNEPFLSSRIEQLLERVKELLGLNSLEDASYFVFTGTTSNSAYNPENGSINILYKDGSLNDVAKASDQLNVSVLSEPVIKYYLCYPKELVKKG